MSDFYIFLVKKTKNNKPALYEHVMYIIWENTFITSVVFLTPCGFWPLPLPRSPSLSPPFLAYARPKTKTHNIKWGVHTYMQTHTQKHTQWETVAESACDLDWCD